MTLTQQDYKNIADQITEGTGMVELSKGGELLHIEYDYEVEGYTEHETNGFIVTSTFFSVDVECTDDEFGEVAAHNFNEQALRQYFW